MATSISINLPDLGEIAVIESIVLRGELGLALIKGSQYTGQVALNRIPAPLLEALREYREIADDQVLSLLDDALMRVLAFEPFARLNPEGTTGQITDLQLYDGRATVVIDFGSPTRE